MSEAGLPGMGLKLGAELLRSPNGVWYSATGADGGTLGVLRFEAALLKPAGAVDRLIERVVAARAGMLPGTLPVVDLVEDAGRIWLITAQVPVADSAGRTEALLLGSTPVSVTAPGVMPGRPGSPGSPGTGTPSRAEMGVGSMAGAGSVAAVGAPGAAGGSGGPVGSDGLGAPGNAGNAGNGLALGYAAQSSGPEAPWRPSVSLGDSRIGQQPQWSKKDLKDPLPRRLMRAVVGLVLVGVVAGAATVVGLKMKEKKPGAPVRITGISVHNQNPVQPSGICNATVDMVAEFTTTGDSGTVHYEWEIPAKNNQVQIVPGTQQISSGSRAVHLDWKLNLHGSGTVTAKFKITNPEVLAPGTDSSSSGDLKFQCP